MLGGFEFAPLNDLDAFERKLDDETIAVFIEPIQGEGGIHEAKDDFLQGLERLCRERKALFMLDEVQSGIGRTGNFLAYGQSGITPDAVALAKGLGGGFPIGAFWISEQYSEVFKPGSHGTTFGGSPLACAAAHAVLDVIEKEDLVKAAREKGLALREGLSRLVERFPSILVEVRGRGLMLALALKDDPADLIESLRKKGLLVVGAAGNSIRFLPPLNVSETEIKSLNVTEEARLPKPRKAKKHFLTESDFDRNEIIEVFNMPLQQTGLETQPDFPVGNALYKNSPNVVSFEDCELGGNPLISTNPDANRAGRKREDTVRPVPLLDGLIIRTMDMILGGCSTLIHTGRKQHSRTFFIPSNLCRLPDDLENGGTLDFSRDCGEKIGFFRGYRALATHGFWPVPSSESKSTWLARLTFDLSPKSRNFAKREVCPGLGVIRKIPERHPRARTSSTPTFG